jgi:hypothetical protein
MSNATFAKSVDAFRAAEKSVGNAFGTLSTFVQECVAAKRSEMPEVKSEALGNVLKNLLTAEENAYKGEKRLTEMPTAYRSAKSVLVQAVSLGIALVDEEGKQVGKSALEKAIKDGKPSTKSEFDKFKSTMVTADAIFAKLDTLHDIQQAKELVRQLADKVLKAEATRMPKAA